MRWRSDVIVAVSLVSAFAQPVALLAQPPEFPAECACLLSPDKPHGPGAPNPGPPGVPQTPGPPVGPGTTDSVGGDGARRTWIYLGAAGVALLAGIPFGGAGAVSLPFTAPGQPAASPELDFVAMTPMPSGSAGPSVGGDAPVVSRGDVVPATLVSGPGQATPGAPAAAAAPAGGTPMPAAVLGLVPPKTATHLPLLGALGVLLVGAGGLLARRATRERRRRRRFVAI